MTADSITNLQRILMDGGKRVFDIAPKAIENIIKERQWIGRRDMNGREFPSFEAFVGHIRWQGLETSIDDLLLYCRRRPDVQSLIRGAVGAAKDHGVNQHTGRDIVTSTQRGNNPTYALRRLKRDRPDLAEKVIAGELSANAAAIEAGFRKKPVKRKRCPNCGHEW